MFKSFKYQLEPNVNQTRELEIARSSALIFLSESKRKSVLRKSRLSLVLTPAASLLIVAPMLHSLLVALGPFQGDSYRGVGWVRSLMTSVEPTVMSPP